MSNFKWEIKKKMEIKHGSKGFILLDILIASLILTSSIAAAMYLFKTGYNYLEKANHSNLLSSKLIQAVSLLKTLNLEKKAGEEDMGDGVTLKWEAQLLSASKPHREKSPFSIPPLYELFLYRINLNLKSKEMEREYQVNVLRYKPLFSPEEMVF
jgi:hypothetical protein